MWIKSVAYEEANDRLRKVYDQAKGEESPVDNVLIVHSLRPHTLEGHMALYRSVLHHSGNELPLWLVELIGVFVSHLNRCAYCMTHHFAGLKKALGDDAKAVEMQKAVEYYDPDMLINNFDYKERLAIDYVRKLTDSPMTIRADDVDGLRASGWSDGEILEINQVAAYFSYANRTVQGLGVTTKGDTI